MEYWKDWEGQKEVWFVGDRVHMNKWLAKEVDSQHTSEGQLDVWIQILVNVQYLFIYFRGRVISIDVDIVKCFAVLEPKSTGCIKKMVHSDFSLKSIPVVGFYLFRGVLEQEFRALTIWAL